jgi:hypothetical protein
MGMGHKTYCAVSGGVFTLVAIAHLLRVIDGTAILVGEFAIPMYLSWIGLAASAALATWGFRLSIQPGA